jgi:transcriptional regulator with GAF, ATPase, and Fis domain
MIVSQGPDLELGAWPPSSATSVPTPPAVSAAATLEDVERHHILGVLQQTGWRVSGERGAAKILGLKATTLESRMKKLGISRRAQA